MAGSIVGGLRGSFTGPSISSMGGGSTSAKPHRYRLSGPSNVAVVQVNFKDLDRVMRSLQQYQSPDYERRAKKIFFQGARMLEKPMKTAAPYNRYPDPIQVKKKRKRGALKNAIKPRDNKLRFGEIGAATVGPVKSAGPPGKRAPHRHLVVYGTKGHSLQPKRAGKGPWEAWVPRKKEPIKPRKSRKGKYRDVDRPSAARTTQRLPDYGPTQRTKLVNAVLRPPQHPGAKARPFVDEVRHVYEPRLLQFLAKHMSKFYLPYSPIGKTGIK